jgi:Transglycosylase
MRVRPGWRTYTLAGTLAAVLLGASLSFGTIVRSSVAREARRRHLVIGVKAVRPAWWAVRLLDVDVAFPGVQGLSLRAADVRVSLGIDLRPKRIEIGGAVANAVGAESTLRSQLAAWAETSSPTGAQPAGPHGHLDLELHDAAARWIDGDSPEPRLDVTGISATLQGDTIHVAATEVRARTGRVALVLNEVAAELTRSEEIRKARAVSALVEWSASSEAPAEAGTRPESSSRPDPGPRPDLFPRKERDPTPPAPAVAAVRAASTPAVGQVRRRPPPAPAADPRAPVLSLPDLHVLRAATVNAATSLAALVAPDADIGVDAVTWKVSRPSDRVAFTIGPGELSLRRDSGSLGVRFVATASGASAPLSLEATLPLDGGDVGLKLDGGPVSLGLLGVREAALGLVAVDRAMVSGRARIALAPDGALLTFDVEAKTSGLSIDNPRLAPEVISGVDLGIIARGVATASGEIRLDDVEASLGRARIEASGVLRQDAEHVDGAFRLEVPDTACQALLDSVPQALLPTVHGARDEGTFGLDGRVVFDTRALDDLSLVYDVRDRCRLTEVPATLAREQFDQPFIQRVVLPDGTIGERTTGPGSDNWTPLESISPYMRVAVLTTEDGAFPRHHGFNRAAIRAALIANLKARRFVRGASTITMQLAKNLFLGREKTLSRKLEEVILTDYLEQTFSKDELMELYLNVIEFGPAVYGVRSAADYYFGRTPAELNLAECLFLSSILPAPIRYGAMRSGGEVPESWMRVLHMLMDVSHKTHRISDAELVDGESEPVVFWMGGDRPASRAPVPARPSFDGEIDDLSTAPVAADNADGP